MSFEEQIKQILLDARDSIRQNLADKGINASGRTSNAINVVRTASGFQLGKFPNGLKTAPVETLEIGRPAGKVPKGFRRIIYQWTIDKGFRFENEGKRWGAATKIAKQIAEEGTRRNKKNEVVYSEAVQQAADTIRRELTTSIGGMFSAEILKQINTD